MAVATSSTISAVPDNTDAGRIKALEDRVDQLTRALANQQLGVGDWIYTSNLPANWNTSNTLILVGNRMVPNGINLSRTDFPDLNTIYSRLGYPFGTGDGSTTFGTADVLGRMVQCIGTHTDVASLNKNDGQTLANRTPKHNSSGGTLTGSPTLSGAPGGTFVTSVSVSTNVAFISSSTTYVTGVSAPTGSPTIGTLAVAKGTLAVGSIGPGGTRPTDMPAYVVAGIWMLIALPL